jgi:spore coat polysaccharide biosynthesis protein SpsF
MKIGVIIEARMSSTRLPGKVLMKVNNKSMLQLIIDRVNVIKKIDTTIVATTINKKDDEIIDWCKLKKIKFFRGSEDNVLNRVYKAAKKFRLRTIILITGDCPLIDHNIISQVLNIYLNNNADYVSNSHIRTYPDGMDVQIFNYKSLSKSNILAKNKIEKEHVTLNIRRNPKIFKPIYVMAPNNLHWPELGLTLDEIGDFKLIKKIIIYFHNKKNFMFNCIDIINFIKKNPILLRYNSKVKRKGDN